VSEIGAVTAGGADVALVLSELAVVARGGALLALRLLGEVLELSRLALHGV